MNREIATMPSYRRTGGFTLIELVVTVAIVAILAAIAIPSYTSYVRQGRRVDAKNALLDMAALEERYFTVNNAYTTSAANLGYSTSASFPITVGSGYYNVIAPVVNAATTSPPAPASYQLEADVVAGSTQAKDTNCQKFFVNSQGAQWATPDTSPASCWQN